MKVNDEWIIDMEITVKQNKSSSNLQPLIVCQIHTTTII